MKLTDIIRISISLLFVVIFGIAFVAMMAKGDYNSAVIFLLAIMLNVISIIMLISEK